MSVADPALRIAFVLGSAARGGTESQAALLIRSLDPQQARVDVFLMDARGCVQDFGPASVHTLAPQGLARRSRTLATAVAALRLRHELKARHFDVVHAAMARAHVLAPFCSPRGPVRPLTVAWRRNTGSHSGNAIFDAVERYVARGTDVLVANSNAVRMHWLGRGHRPRQGFAIVPNALEAWRFAATPVADLTLAAHHLVAVGNLRPAKGHAELIDAAALIRGWGVDVGVVIVGEGALQERLEARARSLAVPLRVVLGIDDPRPYLRAADVYVHPSLTEGASNAVGEAMAQGCRVVSTDVGDAHELLGELGWVCPPGDPKALAKAIHDCLLAGPLAASQREALVGRVRRLRGAAGMVDNHMQIYQRGVNDVRHRRHG